MASKKTTTTTGHGGKRTGSGRKQHEQSARQGLERVTCFVSAADRAIIEAACEQLGLTRGELLAKGTKLLLAQFTLDEWTAATKK